LKIVDVGFVKFLPANGCMHAAHFPLFHICLAFFSGIGLRLNLEKA
jgi:hypothetical protein